MKRLSQDLEIGPKYSAAFEQAGIRTLSELAKVKDLQELSHRTDVPIDMVRQWHEQAKQKIQASRFRRRVATGIAAAGLSALALLVGYLRFYAQADALYAQADALYNVGDYQGALERYDRVIRQEPTNQLAYAHKGGALRRLGRTEKALAALDKALELNPQNVWVLDERGRLYADLRMYDRAIQDFDRAVNLNAQDAWAYNELGTIYHDNLYQYEAAYSNLKKASELKPDRLVYKANFAEAAWTFGHFQEALHLARKILADNEKTDANEFSVSERMSMRLVVISSLLLKGDSARARVELEEFIRYYNSVPPDFQRHWDYSGDRHFIEGWETDGRSKNIILSLIQLLDQPPRSTIEQVKRLVSTLK